MYNLGVDFDVEVELGMNFFFVGLVLIGKCLLVFDIFVEGIWSGEGVVIVMIKDGVDCIFNDFGK